MMVIQPDVLHILDLEVAVHALFIAPSATFFSLQPNPSFFSLQLTKYYVKVPRGFYWYLLL